jgi:L-amino acid N-acyltransferase YncA
MCSNRERVSVAYVPVNRATAQDVEGLRRLVSEYSMHKGVVAAVARGADPRDWLTARAPVVVATDARDCIGFAAAISQRIPCAAPRCAEVMAYVTPAHRRRGVARSLVSELISVARVMGLWKLIAYVLPQDAAARALSTRLDFREVGTLVKHL